MVGTAKIWKTAKNYYDSRERLAISVDPAGNETKMYYDDFNRPTQTIDCYGNKYFTEYETAVISTGATKDKSYFTPNGTTSQQYLTENIMDIYGRVVEKKAFGDNSEWLSEKYKYDYLGNLTGYTDANNNLNSYGVTTHYEYSPADRLTGTVNAKGEYSEIIYDDRGNITNSYVANQRQFTKKYDAQGRLIEDKDQLNKFQYYHYDELGRLDEHTDRNGTVTGFSYDNMNNLTSQTYTGENSTTEFKYMNLNPYGAIVTWQFNGNGTLTGIGENGFTPAGKIQYKYASHVNYAGYSDYIYDNLGRVTKTFAGRYSSSYVNGATTNYSYSQTRLDKVQLDGVSTANTADSVNAKYEYYPNGSLTSVSYPPLANGKILNTS
jgi:YD repeat-containing protein